MKTASSEASHTTTVAPIQVPMPLMESPSVRRSVTSSARNVEISATPPSAADVRAAPLHCVREKRRQSEPPRP